jgi:hypothetical protein
LHYIFPYQIERFEVFVIPHSKVLSLRDRYSGDITNINLPNINQNYSVWIEQTFEDSKYCFTKEDIEEIYQWAITQAYPLLEESPLNWEVAQSISY